MKCKAAMKTSTLSTLAVQFVDRRFNRLTEKFFQKTPWPEAEAIAPIVNNDPTFLILYRELYYRHIYARLSPTIDHRFASYDVLTLPIPTTNVELL